MLLALALLAPLRADAEEGRYRLGPEDRISLRVLEWRATQDEILEWKPMAGEFVVDAEGWLDLPLIGRVEASGRSTDEIGREIGAGLQKLMGLAEAPSVAVQIAEFRPFYVTGEVTRPGPYPFRPKLTVLQAVAIAGGLPRPADPGLLRLGRDAIAARGDLAVLTQELDALRARLGRMRTELDGGNEISFPPELTRRGETPAAVMLMQQERQIFEGRRSALAAQIDALSGLKSFLEQEAVTLQGQIAEQDKQAALVNQELKTVSSLVEKGYAVSTRQLGLERTIAQIQGDKLRLETELLRVRQDSSRTDMSILDLKNNRTNELTSDLRTTQAKIDDTLRKMETAQQLVYEAEVSAPRRSVERGRALRAEPTYVLVRGAGSEVAEIDANENTPVEPGDTIKVMLPLPELHEDVALDRDSLRAEAAQESR